MHVQRLHGTANVICVTPHRLRSQLIKENENARLRGAVDAFARSSETSLPLAHPETTWGTPLGPDRHVQAVTSPSTLTGFDRKS